MFRGYPVGFLLFWAAADPQSRQIGETKHGTDMPSLLIIDGQQRLTSLYSVMKNIPVADENFKTRKISIAFHPAEGKFEVSTIAHVRSPEWIADISELFTSSSSSRKFINAFLDKLEENQGEITAEIEEAISENIERLFNIKGYTFSALEIDKYTDEETVSDIFVRVNSGGQKLNPSDFILTLMSVFWDEGRKELENFCKSTRIPSDNHSTPYNYFIKPEPGDMLRVPIILAFRRARLKYGYQVLLGKNLESGEISKERRVEQFEAFKKAHSKALNVQNWKDFLKCLYAAGFRNERMITSNTTVLYSYALFLVGKYDFALSGDRLMNAIARWFFMNSLTSRYSNSPESRMESDLADLRDLRTGDEFLEYLDKVINNILTDDYWNITLPGSLASASAKSPSLTGYYAALVLLDAHVLFSNLKVSDLIDQVMKGPKEALERHHLFPKAYLKKIGIIEDRDRNQIANFALVEWNKNIEISDEAPASYFPEQMAKYAGQPGFGHDMWLHALPEGWESMEYKEFLEKRRILMAQVIREAFQNKLCSAW